MPVPATQEPLHFAVSVPRERPRRLRFGGRRRRGRSGRQRCRRHDRLRWLLGGRLRVRLRRRRLRLDRRRRRRIRVRTVTAAACPAHHVAQLAYHQAELAARGHRQRVHVLGPLLPQHSPSAQLVAATAPRPGRQYSNDRGRLAADKWRDQTIPTGWIITVIR